MATLQSLSLLSSFSSSLSASSSARRVCPCKLQMTQKLQKNRVSFRKIPINPSVEDELNMIKGRYPTTSTIATDVEDNGAAATVAAELYSIADIAADRAEMHANIGEQRNNWNNLLVTSINAITLTGATLSGIAGTAIAESVLPLKLSSALLYTAATGILMVVNKIQPSQLAEEQRSAARLFRQLHRQIETTLALHNPTTIDVKNAMERVLALDKAYPLPLLGTMLEKFPTSVEPAVWWPSQLRLQQEEPNGVKAKETNGWNGKLEEEMRNIAGMLKRKDMAEYVRLGKLVLTINKILAVAGPLLTGFAAFGSTLVGTPSHGSWALFIAVIAGVLASIVNTLEHGGQVGMVFEMYRDCAGVYQEMEESIESILKEKEVEKRENGELFEMKLALQLGRSPLELRDLVSMTSSSSSSSSRDEDGESSNFVGKLF